MKDTIKIQDTDVLIGSGSKLEQYWQREGFTNFHKKFRRGGGELKTSFRSVTDMQRMLETYKLRAIGFGNWVTQEDRYNYLSALLLALYDLNKVIGFKNNLGLNKTVSFSFGARGSGPAVAHFEPHTFIINVTRYSDESEFSKETRFIRTGGAGAVAHEYGHALDYYFGLFVSKSDLPALSGARSVARVLNQGSTGLREYMDILLEKIIWAKPYTQVSPYYKRLEANFEGNEYVFRRNEIFARAFEKYIQHKLRKAGITNNFLNVPKYDPRSYLTDGEMQKIEPLFDSLIKLMRTKL